MIDIRSGVEMAPSGMMIVQPFSPDIIDLALSSAS